MIKLENVEPVFAEAAMVQSGDYKVTAGIATLYGKVLNHAHIKPKRARFYYRPYLGQVETLYAGEWKMSPWVNIRTDGTFSGTVKLPKGAYEYKAVVEQQNVIIEGENKVLNLP